MKNVTVIMRTFNVEWVIDQALVALMKQKNVEIELIIVDSGSSDSTLDIVSNYSHKFIEIEPGTYFPGKVLNKAVSEAKTELIVFINSDVVLLDSYAISKLIEPLSNSDTAASYGRQVIRPEADLWVRHDYEKAFTVIGNQPKWMHYSLPIAAMKKSVWEMQKFYTDSWGSEDTHWGVQIKNKGYKIAYVKDAIAMHSHNYTLKQLASRRRIEGEADVYIYPEKSLSLFKTLLSFGASFLRESLYYLKNRQTTKIPYLLLNRIVYSFSFYRGFKYASKSKNNITFGNYQA
ncbi:glycosyltransferase [Sulfurimonas sp.]|uniref:glycosyltransferase family 2 protein n=1 Tax=Sulfurimonas sp. TaxID=2022749 RepID=UPI0025F2B3D0|nr:glycosyltransferase [Sulfurimonas sp.]